MNEPTKSIILNIISNFFDNILAVILQQNLLLQIMVNWIEGEKKVGRENECNEK